MTPPSTDDEQEKYRAWISELESRRASLARSMRVVNWLFIAAPVTGIPLMFFSVWGGLAVAAFWLIIASTARYLIMMYRWQYALQIDRTRADAHAMAEWRARPREQDLPQDADDEVRARHRTRRIPRQAVWRMPWQR